LSLKTRGRARAGGRRQRGFPDKKKALSLYAAFFDPVFRDCGRSLEELRIRNEAVRCAYQKEFPEKKVFVKKIR
jgi:hypothetical protein